MFLQPRGQRSAIPIQCTISAKREHIPELYVYSCNIIFYICVDCFVTGASTYVHVPSTFSRTGATYSLVKNFFFLNESLTTCNLHSSIRVVRPRIAF